MEYIILEYINKIDCISLEQIGLEQNWMEQ